VVGQGEGKRCGEREEEGRGLVCKEVLGEGVWESSFGLSFSRPFREQAGRGRGRGERGKLEERWGQDVAKREG
jgi:hypothetical protein